MTIPTQKRKRAPKNQPLLDLHVPQDPDGAVTATMPLAWCFKPGDKLQELITERGFTKPYLLVVARKKVETEISKIYGEETWGDFRASLVPLTQGLQYFSFNSHGENQLLAFVVDVPEASDMKTLRKEVSLINKGTQRESSSFNDKGQYAQDGEDRYSRYNMAFFSQARFLTTKPDILHVMVPREMFAPEPAQWRKTVVSRIFSSSKAVDQCHFRKKFIAALALSPLRIVLATIGKLLYLTVGLICLAPRNLAWKKFLDPWAGPFGVVEASPDANSWFYQKRREDSRSESSRIGWQNLLSPLTLFGPATVAYGIANIPVHYTGTETTHPWWEGVPDYFTFVLLFDVLAVGIPVALFLIIGGALWVWEKLTGMDLGWNKKDADAEWKRKQQQQELRRQRLLAELELMRCGANPPPMSVGDLPRDKQTVYLRFAGLKTKVCRPFAR